MKQPLMRYSSILAAIACLCLLGPQFGCGGGGGQKIHTYPKGQTLRVDDYDGRRRLTKSVWHLPSGAVAQTTNWTKSGEGFEYVLRENGSVKLKMTMKNYLPNGTSWTYAEDGSCVATEEYSRGVKHSLMHER